MTRELFDRVRGLVSEPAVNEAALRAACYAASAELEAGLKKGVTPEGLGERFEAAAALLALGLYGQIGENTGVSAFKAGDVSVSCRDAREKAASLKAMRALAARMLAGELEDGGFEFRGAPG